MANIFSADLTLPSELISACLLSVAFAAMAGAFLVASSSLHERWTHDPIDGTQKRHGTSVPRVGGAAIYCALVATYYLQEHGSDSAIALKFLIVAAGPAFAIGLAEDLSKRVSVVTRLFVTASAGIFAIVSSGTVISSVGLGQTIDAILGIRPIAIVFTAIALAGLSNAFNLIDGLNGLAATKSILLYIAIAMIAFSNQDSSLALVSLFLASATAGFLLWNWPWGKLFLGDGGAYFLGFTVGWLAILLPQNNPAVSPWASLLILIYPITETLYSIWRRMRANASPGEPDQWHLHTLVNDYLRSIGVFRSSSRLLVNSVAGMLCVALSIPPVIIAVVFYSNTALLGAACVAHVVLYVASYRLLFNRLHSVSR